MNYKNLHVNYKNLHVITIRDTFPGYHTFKQDATTARIRVCMTQRTTAKKGRKHRKLGSRRLRYVGLYDMISTLALSCTHCILIFGVLPCVIQQFYELFQMQQQKLPQPHRREKKQQNTWGRTVHSCPIACVPQHLEHIRSTSSM